MITQKFGKQAVFGMYKASGQAEAWTPHVRRTRPILTSLLLAAALTCSYGMAAESPVPLGAAGNFAVLAGSTVTSTGGTIVNGDLGVWPGTAVTGFLPGIVNGAMHAGDPTAQAAQGDLTIAFNDAAARSTAPVSISGNLGGLTLVPGLYKSASSLEISAGDLTLDAQGDANAVFIFQMASTFVTTSGRQVILAGGAQAANVFWQVGSSATIGTTSVVKGNILADQSISLQTGATLDGRALARIGAVTMDSNLVNGTGGNSTPPPVCAPRISCAFTLSSNATAYVIALNRSTACVILDSSACSNSTSAAITNCLALGCHSIVFAGGETNLCVITSGEAVDLLIALLEDADLGTKKKGCGYKGSIFKGPLFPTLKTAVAAFNRGSFDAGINQLQGFQNKIHAQLGRSHPAHATLLIDSAQEILDAIDCSARMFLQGVRCHHDGDDDDNDHDGDNGDHHHRSGDDDHEGNDKHSGKGERRD